MVIKAALGAKMRWSTQWVSLAALLLCICGIAVSCATVPAPGRPAVGKDSWWLKKTVIYQSRDSSASYVVLLSANTGRSFTCKINVENSGSAPIFFFRAKQTFSERASQNGSELHFSIGDARLYSDYSIPRLDEIAPGKRLRATYQIDCKGECSDINFVYVDFDMIVEKGKFFHDLFRSVPNYGDRLGVNVGKDWRLFYSYLETEAVSFSIVPLKP